MAGQKYDLSELVNNMERMGWPARRGRGQGHLIITSPAGKPININLNVSAGSGYQDSMREIRAAGYFDAWEAYVDASRRPAHKVAAKRGGSRRPPEPVLVPAEALPEAPGGMVTRTVLLTPKLATEYLERPPAKLDDGTEISQRSLDGAWVDEIASWIETDEWDESYEGLALDPSGSLLEGMHRCWAVVQTGKAVKVRVTFNAPARLFQITNQGKKRSNAHILQTLNDPSARDLASALRMIWEYERWLAGDKRFTMVHWRNWTTPKMSGPTLIKVRTAHTPPECEIDVHDSMPMVGPMRKLKGVTAAGVAFHHLAALHWKGNPDVLATFVEKLRTGAMLAPGDPVLAFREWCRQAAGKRLLDKRERQFLGLLKAWNAVTAGAELRRVYIGENEGMMKFPTHQKRRRNPKVDE